MVSLYNSLLSPSHLLIVGQEEEGNLGGRLIPPNGARANKGHNDTLGRFTKGSHAGPEFHAQCLHKLLMVYAGKAQIKPLQDSSVYPLKMSHIHDNAVESDQEPRRQCPDLWITVCAGTA